MFTVCRMFTLVFIIKILLLLFSIIWSIEGNYDAIWCWKVKLEAKLNAGLLLFLFIKVWFFYLNTKAVLNNKKRKIWSGISSFFITISIIAYTINVLFYSSITALVCKLETWVISSSVILINSNYITEHVAFLILANATKILHCAQFLVKKMMSCKLTSNVYSGTHRPIG